MDKLLSVIFMIGVLLLVLPSFLQSNSQLKQFLKNLSIWIIVVFIILMIIYLFKLENQFFIQSGLLIFIEASLVLKFAFSSKFSFKYLIKAKGQSLSIKTLPISISLLYILSPSCSIPLIIFIGNNLFESLFFNLISAVFY